VRAVALRVSGVVTVTVFALVSVFISTELAVSCVAVLIRVVLVGTERMPAAAVLLANVLAIGVTLFVRTVVARVVPFVEALAVKIAVAVLIAVGGVVAVGGFAVRAVVLMWASGVSTL
jgi:hypothetical protein